MSDLDAHLLFYVGKRELENFQKQKKTAKSYRQLMNDLVYNYHRATGNLTGNNNKLTYKQFMKNTEDKEC